MGEYKKKMENIKNVREKRGVKNKTDDPIKEQKDFLKN